MTDAAICRHSAAAGRFPTGRKRDKNVGVGDGFDKIVLALMPRLPRLPSTLMRLMPAATVHFLLPPAA